LCTLGARKQFALDSSLTGTVALDILAAPNGNQLGNQAYISVVC